MNYLYFYSGKLPKHIYTSFESVLANDPKSKIYLCSDSIPTVSDVQHIDVQEINSDFVKHIKKINYFKGEENPLWETSLLRIFYLYEASKLLNIDQFIHFDADILLFKSFEQVKKSFKQNKFNITPVNELFLIFGYSFIDDLEVFYSICENLIEIISDAKNYEEKFYNSNRLNEMILLNLAYIQNPNRFNLLDVVPSENSDIVFDPISYGQYVAGIDGQKFSKGYIDDDHYVGREILNKGYKILFENKQPYILHDGNYYELVNLHLHKKNLKKYIKRWKK